MSPCVVDASVVIKWYVPEVHAESATRILEAGGDLLAPELLLAEIGSILWKKSRRGDISATEAREILEGVLGLPLQLEPIEPLVSPALEMALLTERPVYDSLYVALALESDCRLVTADLRLFNGLREGPFADAVQWIEDAS